MALGRAKPIHWQEEECDRRSCCSAARSSMLLLLIALTAMRRDINPRPIGKKMARFLAWMFLGLQAARAATFQIADPVEFSKIIDTNAVLTTNATLNTWLEGPVWVPSGGGYLV